MKRPLNKNPLSDFIDFLKTSPKTPPDALREDLFAFVKEELHPNSVKVFFKILVVHLFSGAVTLSFCPQLGWSPYSQSMGIMEYFMAFGSVGCALACGSVFLGMSMAVAAFLLKREEVRVVQEHKLGNISILAAISYGALMLVGGESELLYSVFWVIGGIAGGYLSLTFLPLLKTRLRHI